MSQYTYRVVNVLEPDEVRRFQERHLPNLRTLNQRYFPDLDISASFPVTPLVIDALRTFWRLDPSTERPSEEVATSGLGLAFGTLLERCTALRWCNAQDSDGEFQAMVKYGEDPTEVMVPPFAYVARRHSVENAEVFRHFFEQMSPEHIGFVRPPNWLLDQ